MSRLRDMVREFHETYGVKINPVPTTEQVSQEDKDLRIALIEEEFKELRDAIEANDIVEIADACADLKYVVEGTEITFGIDGDAVLEEVHRSNMSKLGADGKPIYSMTGKVLKGPNFEEPDINKVLLMQVLNYGHVGEARVDGNSTGPHIKHTAFFDLDEYRRQMVNETSEEQGGCTCTALSVESRMRDYDGFDDTPLA